MKKFKFKLEPVLKYRKILKDKQLGVYAQRQKAVFETEEYLKELDDKKVRLQKQMISEASEGFSLFTYECQAVYSRMVDNTKSHEKTRLVKRKRALMIEGQKLVNLSKEEKSIEKLKDKAYQLYQKEYLDCENKQIDDLVNSRFGLKTL